MCSASTCCIRLCMAIPGSEFDTCQQKDFIGAAARQCYYWYQVAVLQHQDLGTLYTMYLSSTAMMLHQEIFSITQYHIQYKTRRALTKIHRLGIITGTRCQR